MSYPEPRRVVVTWADMQGLTVLERARACVLAGVDPEHARDLMNRYAAGDAGADELLAGALLCYAVAYELELRLDPALTWEQAQTWDLALDVRGARDPMLEAEARAVVETSTALGIPLDRAGDVTMAQLDAFAAVGEERARARGAPRGARRGRRSGAIR